MVDSISNSFGKLFGKGGMESKMGRMSVFQGVIGNEHLREEGGMCNVEDRAVSRQ